MSTPEQPKETFDATALTLCERVKEHRKKRHWTLEQLSDASGVSRSMLSQIERGQANPTLAVACKIAQAFGISIGDLVEEPWAASGISVIRADDPAHIYRSDDKCQIRTLSPLNMEKDIEFYELILAPGATIDSAPHFDGTKEFLTVHKGTMKVISGTDTCELKKGDSAHYRADTTHSIKNTSKIDAHAFLVVTYG